MSDSLRKAFIAGWHAHMNYAPQDFPSDEDVGRIFDGWHTYAYLPMTRDASADNPGPPPIPTCPPHDYKSAPNGSQCRKCAHYESNEEAMRRLYKACFRCNQNIDRTYTSCPECGAEQPPTEITR